MESLKRRTWCAKVQKNASESAKIGRHGPTAKTGTNSIATSTGKSLRQRCDRAFLRRSPVDGRSSEWRDSAMGTWIGADKNGFRRNRAIIDGPAADERARRRHDLTPGYARTTTRFPLARARSFASDGRPSASPPPPPRRVRTRPSSSSSAIDRLRSAKRKAKSFGQNTHSRHS